MKKVEEYVLTLLMGCVFLIGCRSHPAITKPDNEVIGAYYLHGNSGSASLVLDSSHGMTEVVTLTSGNVTKIIGSWSIDINGVKFEPSLNLDAADSSFHELGNYGFLAHDNNGHLRIVIEEDLPTYFTKQ